MHRKQMLNLNPMKTRLVDHVGILSRTDFITKVTGIARCLHVLCLYVVDHPLLPWTTVAAHPAHQLTGRLLDQVRKVGRTEV